MGLFIIKCSTLCIKSFFFFLQIIFYSPLHRMQGLKKNILHAIYRYYNNDTVLHFNALQPVQSRSNAGLKNSCIWFRKFCRDPKAEFLSEGLLLQENEPFCTNLLLLNALCFSETCEDVRVKQWNILHLCMLFFEFIMKWTLSRNKTWCACATKRSWHDMKQQIYPLGLTFFSIII